MADPLLTNLCAICHTAVPKYKCPRCSKRTCSLPCVNKHKTWSRCDGLRDATAYKRNALSTRSGVDHDYNFLSAIERDKKAAEHVLVHGRGVIAEDELRPIEVQHVEWKWRDGKARKVLVTRHLRKGRQDEEDKVMGRCRRLGIQLVRAPIGMSMRRENGVRFSERLKSVVWAVRWLLVSAEDPRGREFWTNNIDFVRIGQAFLQAGRKTAAFAAASREVKWVHDDESKDVEAFTCQDPTTTAWAPTRTQWRQLYHSRDSSRSGAWVSTDREFLGPSAPYPEWIKWLRGRVQFYLSQRSANSGSAEDAVIPADPEERLKDILSGTVVFEYPTIYVVQKQTTLPSHCRVQEQSAKKPDLKRKRDEETRGRRSSKKIKPRELEDGEVPSEDEAEADDDNGLDSESDVVAEVELGDDNDDDDNSDSDSDDEDLTGWPAGCRTRPEMGAPKVSTLPIS